MSRDIDNTRSQSFGFSNLSNKLDFSNLSDKLEVLCSFWHWLADEAVEVRRKVNYCKWNFPMTGLSVSNSVALVGRFTFMLLLLLILSDQMQILLTKYSGRSMEVQLFVFSEKYDRPTDRPVYREVTLPLTLTIMDLYGVFVELYFCWWRHSIKHKVKHW